MANAVTAFLDDHLATGAGARPAITTPAERATDREPYALLLPDGLQWVAARLPAYQRPRRIVVVEDVPLRARAERLA